MASPSVIILSILLGLLSLSADAARPGPCNTLIFFTSTTTSSYYPNEDNPNPNPNPNQPRSITLFLTRVRHVYALDRPSPLIFKPQPELVLVPKLQNQRQHQNELLEEEQDPFFFFGGLSSSFRERTKDILRVVGSLLFGVGCGALTAATLYLIWSLFAPASRFEFEPESDDDFDSDYDVSPKKSGYVAIPAAEKPAPAPAKEVV